MAFLESSRVQARLRSGSSLLLFVDCFHFSFFHFFSVSVFLLAHLLSFLRLFYFLFFSRHIGISSFIQLLLGVCG
ncbi:hypothetical protein B0T19DRAFT_425275 [Cercophora scortea]|uniref:Transmembrane protein n=1 Tax=Cercophora scortea TaxID=314031 RepID=A0AAE0IF61_9PEZI|nr:hypothetical protein B0T19DRAFT_425275 [Cercophora scortea]